MNGFGLESKDNHSSQVAVSWLIGRSRWIAGRGCRTNCESAPEKGYLWINRHYLFSPPLPRPPLSYVSWALSSTLPAASLNTHTETGLQGCQGDGNVILNCCHLCSASIGEKGRKENDIKNKYVDCSVHRLRRIDGQKKRERSHEGKEIFHCYCSWPFTVQTSVSKPIERYSW